MLPYAIEWQTDKHPSANMPDLDCSLNSLEIYHPYPKWIQSHLESIGAIRLVKINSLPKNEAPYLIASIQTPSGVKELSSCTVVNR